MPHSTLKKNRWQDHYARKAQKEHYPARSVYKLKEIQRKYRLIRQGDHILDLGCAPGAWLLYAAEQTGEQGRVLGIDLKAVTISTPSHVRAITGDIFNSEEALSATVDYQFNVVLSDMAPATTGNKHIDAARSQNLADEALNLAQRFLKPGGNFACKIFQSGDFQNFTGEVRRCFKTCKTFKPQSSRKASREIYVIGMKKL
ncbi:RlmE family RNA methyltransferase [Desulfococcaceae bacterium HSG7]|nr:RlmE family RNA methyltransferase [Desulfococcaceae bacterium HSG7]